MFGLFDDTADCRCAPHFDARRLVVDSDACPGRGVLAAEPACRETVVAALETRDVDSVLTRAGGSERAYDDDSAALLVAAGRFADAVEFRDESLAARARRDPLGAAHEATGRAGAVSRLVAETGLAEGAARVADYEAALRPFVGPTVASARVAVRPPPGASLVERRDLEGGAVVRLYETDAGRHYHLAPVEGNLDSDALGTLAAAYERLASGEVEGGRRAPGRAVRAVATEDDPVETLASVLRKHTRGLGIVEDLLSDPAVSDVFASAPVAEGPLWVRVDGEAMPTGVRLTQRGMASFASRFRRTSGRGFSRAAPTLDTTTRVAGRRVRVAGVTDPVADGLAFAFRAHDTDAFRLEGLVGNGTVPPAAAAVLSLSVERGAAVLVAGERGAGKTTLLGALLFELSRSTRAVVIEDTPELPLDELRNAGRDVQSLVVSRESGPGIDAHEAVRTALRLGGGALVVGEIRGGEASALYEAMRAGASDGAVLGTVHGEGATGVRDRVVEDLGVPPAAFAETDLVVTCARTRDGRRVAGIEEIVGAGATAESVTLFEAAGGVTGRIARGESSLVAGLASPTETYADVRAALETRRGRFE